MVRKKEVIRKGLLDENEPAGVNIVKERRAEKRARRGKATDTTDSPDGGGIVILLIIQRHRRPIN